MGTNVQSTALQKKLEQDSEFNALRQEIDKLLVLQSSDAAHRGDEEAVGHLQARGEGEGRSLI